MTDALQVAKGALKRGGVADLSKAEEVLSGVAGMLEGMLK